METPNLNKLHWFRDAIATNTRFGQWCSENGFKLPEGLEPAFLRFIGIDIAALEKEKKAILAELSPGTTEIPQCVWRPMPTYGEVMTADSFFSKGSYTGGDGSYSYATKSFLAQKAVGSERDSRFTHVVYFSK